MDMRRRDFITCLGGAIAAWPLPAPAQQSGPQRRIGVILGYVEGDPQGQTRATALQQGLADNGWVVGRNLRIDYRHAGGDLERMRTYAAEFVQAAPDVI